MVMVPEEKDINDIFDDIALTEERITKKGYEEGFKEGVNEGNLEGYQLGYAKGVELGSELGSIYGIITASLLKESRPPKVRKLLEDLKLSIEGFPSTNDPDKDILEIIQNIRTQFKKVKSILRIPDEGPDKKDLTF